MQVSDFPDYFQQILEGHAKLYTNVLEINTVINRLKIEGSLNLALEFNKIIEESILTSAVHMSWFGRRLRKSTLKQFFSFRESQIQINHCIIFEEIKRKKINVILSFDDRLKIFGIPLMPQS